MAATANEASQTTRTIGILNGSFRAQSNGGGIAKWLSEQLATVLQSHDDPAEIRILDSSTAPLPLGPVTEFTLPAMIQKSDDYPSEALREWSKIVSSLSGLIIVTPQYNWGYPGELKNALDHLFHEFKDLPVAIFTFGGHGGGKCGTQLAQVLKGGLDANLVSSNRVEIVLPKAFIVGGARVGQTDGDQGDAFLEEYSQVAREEMEKLLVAARSFSRPTSA